MYVTDPRKTGLYVFKCVCLFAYKHTCICMNYMHEYSHILKGVYTNVHVYAVMVRENKGVNGVSINR